MIKFKFDTHVHTNETSRCGKVRASEMVKMYKNEGYSGVVITDHYTKDFFDDLPDITWEEKINRFSDGYKNAFEAGCRLGLTVIAGIELRFTENANDYLVYGINEKFLKENRELYNLGLNEFRKIADSYNLLIYQAHPFRKNMERAKPDLLDGVEIFNGNPRHESDNEKALKYACDNFLKMISGSDFHRSEDLARGGIVISRNIKDSAELVHILNNNEIIDYIKSAK